MSLFKIPLVWVTDRMNQKEDELAELQEHIEKYESLLAALKHAKPEKPLLKLYSLAFPSGK